MAILNGSFETPLVDTGVTVVSLPADFDTETTLGVDTLDYADFLSDTAGTETYEAGWGAGADNQDRLPLFVLADLSDADFDTPAAPGENFEDQWGNNEDRTSELVNITLATFDVALVDFEDFEDEWGGNENRLSFLAPGDITVALFDAANDPFEDFEQEWGGNENRIAAFAPGDITVATFTKQGGTDLFENFEESLTLVVPTVDDTGGAAIATDPSQHSRVTVAFPGAADADIVVQYQRAGSVSFIPAPAAPWASAGDEDLESGIVAVRMWTDDWRAGAPTALLKWRPMETF